MKEEVVTQRRRTRSIQRSICRIGRRTREMRISGKNREGRKKSRRRETEGG